ncbi:zincin, partial [Patellaria atrata CBS 101060]
MTLLRALTAAVATLLISFTTPTDASSRSRNPLGRVGIVHNSEIHTQNHRVTALSEFQLSFDVYGQRIKLKLEPNHDIIAEGATITYLDSDGNVRHREPIQRLEHKVFKGITWVEGYDGQWERQGWARVSIRRDGVDPLFEAAFSLRHGKEHHHVQLSSNYAATKHAEDPVLDWRQGEDEWMVVWRDSDILKSGELEWEHTELKRRTEDRLSCRSDTLDFNMRSDHPVYGKMLKRDDIFWGASLSSLFSKRQLDNFPGGSGNSAGVNLESTIGQTRGCPTTRKVALVGVATDCTYIATFNSTESARKNVIDQMNMASDLYERTFNITLGLQNLTVNDATCPGTPPSTAPWNVPCSDSVDIQDRLNLFSNWRGGQVDNNAYWTLLSNCPTGSAVGLAWLGQACVQGNQNSNSSGTAETVAGANVVMRTNSEWQVIAHEVGHTFGAVHDCTQRTCSDGTSVSAQQCCPLASGTCNAQEQFIMNPSTADGITEFSPCTIGNICHALLRNSVNSDCLTNNRDVTTITGQQCGNGIVEEGEDCDCGGEDNCGDNACCDASTCTFKQNAVCDDSNEDCCRNCQFASSNTVCRASTGICDPEEKCTGNTPYCPDDVTSPDGDGCGDGLKCASGQCTSRDMQCKTVMGNYLQGNVTHACDSRTCQLSCASPEFGPGVCYGLQQNFLDGTECGGGGKCDNGRCRGSNFGKEVTSWINDHKPLVIGVSCAIGGLVILSIIGCIFRRCRRPKRPK